MKTLIERQKQLQDELFADLQDKKYLSFGMLGNGLAVVTVDIDTKQPDAKDMMSYTISHGEHTKPAKFMTTSIDVLKKYLKDYRSKYGY
jgi:hypothetical protein